MIFGNIKNLNEFDYLKDNIKKCFEYAKANDLNTYEKGTYKIDGENLFVNIVEYTTTDSENRFWEAHRQYLDLHLMLNGIEQIDLNFIDNMEQKEFVEKGEIIHASDLIPNYTGTQIKKTLEDIFSIPCEVENDVNCAGLAEYFSGSAKGSSISLCLTIGTGIGGSIIINDRVFHGFSGSACEVGYMNMFKSKFEDLGATSILVKKVAKLKNCSENHIDGKLIFEMAKNNDEDCIKAIDEMVDILGMGIANICYVINPEVVVLGGGIMAQKDYLYDKIRLSLDKYLIPTISSKTKLEFAKNQNKAGMLGAYYNFISIHKD